MALNTTGPMSLAGTIVGQSIEIELGGTGTAQITLGDANVRALLGIPTGPISLNDAYGKSNDSYWICEIDNALFGRDGRGQAIDSLGNTYIVYTSRTTTDSAIIKIDPEGYFVSAISVDSLNSQFITIAIRNDELYVVAYNYLYGSSKFVIKFNTSFSVIWTLGIDTSPATTLNESVVTSIIPTSSGVAFTLPASTANGSSQVFHISSSGTIINNFGTGTRTSFVIGQDVSGNLIISGSGDSASATRCVYKKVNSSNVVVNSLVGTFTGMQAGCYIQSSDIAFTMATGTNRTIYKINCTTPAVLAQKNITNALYRDMVYSATDGYIYFTLTLGTDNTSTYLIKMDTNFNIIWQRKFTLSLATTSMFSLLKRIGGNVYLFIKSAVSGGYYFPIKYPSSGGTTGSFVVNGITVTISASSLAFADTTNSLTTTSANTTATPTIASGSFTTYPLTAVVNRTAI